MSKLDFLAEQPSRIESPTSLPKFKKAMGVSNPILQGIESETFNKEAMVGAIQSEHAEEWQLFEFIDIDLIDDPLVPQRWHYDVKDVSDMAKSLLSEGDGDAIRGQRMPILLFKKPNNRYEIIEGKTRVLAFKEHHLGKKIKAIVSTQLDPKTAYRIGYVANEGRNQLTDYDKGMSFRALLNQHVFETQEELCATLCIRKATLSKLLCFAKLPDSTRDIVERDKSRFGYNTAQLLFSLSEKSSESHLNSVAEKVLSGWSVSQLSSHIARFDGNKPKRQKQQKKVSILGQLGQLECNSKRLALDLDVSGLSEEEKNKIWYEIDNVLRSHLDSIVDQNGNTN